jgi:hypothetical protein
MAESSAPLDFLREAQTDAKLGARVFAALQRGGRLTAGEITEIAAEFGYKFTRSEFEKDVRQNMEERFAAGDESLGHVVENMEGSPESSCAKGCLSWTHNWHPPPIELEA